MTHIKVIIPAFNEEDSIGKVIAEIPKEVSEIIVVNNASTDNTVESAKNAGAKVLDENNRGYGYACLRGLRYVANQTKNQILLFFLMGIIPTTQKNYRRLLPLLLMMILT